MVVDPDAGTFLLLEVRAHVLAFVSRVAVPDQLQLYRPRGTHVLPVVPGKYMK